MPRDRIKHELFPPIEPFATGFLEVGDGHRLYWEESGNPAGAPVVFLHGGPGAGASPGHRRFFDPAHYRIVILDQRGAGRSTPLGELRHNTTEALVADIERLRADRGIEAWHVFGGSWGSTLALAYAQTHPASVRSLTLRGIFLMTGREIDWFLHDMGRVFPEHHRDFIEFLPADERGDVLGSYFRRLTDPDRAVWLPAARSWSRYESRCSTLMPADEALIDMASEAHALGLARIEAHFFSHNRFVPEDRLLRDIDRIRHIPARIIQGRYDMVCPAETALMLHDVWPEAALFIIADAGHSAMEPGIRSALVAATEHFKSLDD